MPLIKHFWPWSKPTKRKPECIDLPDDVLLTILSKLDVVTLRRCTLALSQDDILPKITSLSTSLPVSLFSQDMSELWYGKLLNRIVVKSAMLCLSTQGNLNNPSYMLRRLLLLGLFIYWWVNTPRLSRQVVRFFQRRLTGLRSLEVELPDLPCCHCRARPNLWFKWRAELGVRDKLDHFVYVFGDILDTDEDNEMARDGDLFDRGLRILMRHTMLHLSMMELVWENDSWETGISFKTRDIKGNGGLEIGPRLQDFGRKIRPMCLYLPSTSIFSDDDAKVQEVVLMFMGYARADDAITTDDLMKACLSSSGNKEGEENQAMELRQLVSKILADDNCLVLG